MLQIDIIEAQNQDMEHLETQLQINFNTSIILHKINEGFLKNYGTFPQQSYRNHYLEQVVQVFKPITERFISPEDAAYLNEWIENINYEISTQMVELMKSKLYQQVKDYSLVLREAQWQNSNNRIIIEHQNSHLNYLNASTMASLCEENQNTQIESSQGSIIFSIRFQNLHDKPADSADERRVDISWSYRQQQNENVIYQNSEWKKTLCPLRSDENQEEDKKEIRNRQQSPKILTQTIHQFGEETQELTEYYNGYNDSNNNFEITGNSFFEANNYLNDENGYNIDNSMEILEQTDLYGTWDQGYQYQVDQIEDNDNENSQLNRNCLPFFKMN